MPEAKQKFEGLSEDYDRFRPRYPLELMRGVAARVGSRDQTHVVDAGAGTGVALESLMPLLGSAAHYQAVDVSADMVSVGRSKFPTVAWFVEPVEPFLERTSNVDLIVAAQSFQWMDRPRFLHAAERCLSPNGVLAIIQNNRNFAASQFLDGYESLLEELSPGYSRRYRDFDFAAELAEVFPADTVEVEIVEWAQSMSPDDYVGMVRSSTQAQRAIAAHEDVFLTRLTTHVRTFTEADLVTVPYRSELITGRKSAPTNRGGV